VNLADVMGKADPRREPRRDQAALLDGDTPVTMLAILDRTCVVLHDGERVLVRLDRLDVDAEHLHWQKRQLTPREAFTLRRAARSRSA
jgi:hypothetical protein